jgi:hypothetical protein
MSTGAHGVALWQPLGSGTTPAPQLSAQLSSVPGLAGWWDASTTSSLAGPAGAALTAWNQAVGAVADRSGASNALAPFSFTTPGGPPLATARLAGLLGGLGRPASVSNAFTPSLDPDLGFQIPASVVNWSGSWTWYFVWSRPNWRQGSGRDTNPITLLSVGGMPVLQADSLGGSNRLVLFPGSAQTVLSQALTRRHTHSIVLQMQTGGGVSAWLDGTRVATSAASPQLSQGASPVLFLHDGTLLGGAQCWFHEAACWSRALTSTEIAQVLSYAARWYRGNRRAVVLLVDGQSNAVNYALNDGAAALLAQGVAWHTGALSYGIIASTGNATDYTLQSGHGIYAVTNGNYPGSFLQNPQDGSDPSTWGAGNDGIAVQRALSALASYDASDICAIVWPWNETDSLRNYGELATFTAAAKRFLGLERGMLNRQAGNLPLIWWNAIPYGSAGGMQMHRAAVAALAADATQNVVIGNSQTADSNPRGSDRDPTTGIATGGDIAHRDGLDNQRFARLAAPVVARALIASGLADSISNVPVGLPSTGGPRIIHAYRQSNTSVILTIQHDSGTDLQVPLQAALGVGFAVMDGGTPSSPGNIVNATACVRIDSTHLALTLATPITNISASCGVYYPYGGATIGRGNAVTDNYSTCTKPPGWDVAADLGTAWRLDYPLAATFNPVPVSDTP